MNSSDATDTMPEAEYGDDKVWAILTEDEKKTRFRLAFAIWLAEQGDQMPNTPQERRAAFEEQRKAYIHLAMRVIRRLQKEGMTITPVA